MGVDFTHYDFLDFGASEGGSIDFAMRIFGAKMGLGIDIDPEKVEEMREAGYDCLEADITSLEVPADAVRFVVISHLLEHLPGLHLVEATLRSAAKTASDFIFIQGPFFDADHYLKDQGLKLYWADWYGHPCHLTTWELREILEKVGLHDYVLMVCNPIEDSDHSAVHPLNSPSDQHEYDAAVHPPKKKVRFDRTLYREIICCVRLGPFESWPLVVETVRKHKNAVILDEATDSEIDWPRFSREVREDRKIRWEDVSPDLRLMARLREVHRRLLIDRVWNFVNYLHVREALRLTEGVETALFTNRSRCYIEVALALEFPQIRFHILPPTDIPSANYDPLRELVKVWELDNIYELKPKELPERQFDFVAAMEVLRGVPEDAGTVERLMQMSGRYFWLLSPFTAYPPAEESPWMGYGLEEFRGLCGDVRFIELRGCYWVNGAVELKVELEALGNDEITGRFERLRVKAEDDLVEEKPFAGTALGVWALMEKQRE